MSSSTRRTNTLGRYFITGRPGVGKSFVYDAILVLTLDDPNELRRRLESRNAHDKGQSAENIDGAVKRFLTKQSELLACGGIAIDNSRPLAEVLDHIIEVTRATR